MELPATLPASLREQIMALMPYAIRRCIYAGGEFEIDFKIPDDAFLTTHWNTDILRANGISFDITRDGCESIVTSFSHPPATMPLGPNYTIVTLTFNR